MPRRRTLKKLAHKSTGGSLQPLPAPVDPGGNPLTSNTQSLARRPDLNRASRTRPRPLARE
jgi:hypothetical protein